MEWNRPAWVHAHGCKSLDRVSSVKCSTAPTPYWREASRNTDRFGWARAVDVSGLWYKEGINPKNLFSWGAHMATRLLNRGTNHRPRLYRRYPDARCTTGGAACTPAPSPFRPGRGSARLLPLRGFGLGSIKQQHHAPIRHWGLLHYNLEMAELMSTPCAVRLQKISCSSVSSSWARGNRKGGPVSRITLTPPAIEQRSGFRRGDPSY